MNRQTICLSTILWSLILILPTCAPSVTQQPGVTASIVLAVTPTSLLLTPTPASTSTAGPSPTTALMTPTPADGWTSQSPNGKWSAQGMMEGPFLADDGSEKYHTRLEVINSDSTVTWTLVDQTSNYGLGYTTPRPFHWSRDGRYLYFTNQAVPDGCAVFANGSDLYRADLSDGQITEIVPPWVWWISLSPDEQTAVYIRWNGQALELVARDIASGSERQTKLEGKYTQAGNIVWSPDGQALMLVLAAHPCDPANWVQSIARVDLATLAPILLVREDKRLFSIAEWPEMDQVLLVDEEKNSWTMNAVTGDLEKGP